MHMAVKTAMSCAPVRPEEDRRPGTRPMAAPSSAQGRNGDGNAFGAGEAKQQLQDEGELLAQPRQDRNALIRLRRCGRRLPGALGEQQHEGADEKDAGNDLHAHFHTGSAAFGERGKPGAKAAGPDRPGG